MEPLEDSACFIARLGMASIFEFLFWNQIWSLNYILERKLERIKKKNESGKVSGKDLIASMAEYKEIYMRNAFKNNIDLNSGFDYSNNQVIDVSYIQVWRYYFP